MNAVVPLYDIIVIGGGPGGYNAALAAAKAGLNVLLAEKNKLGGVCLNEGCIPSKALLYSAKLLEGAKNGEKYGVTASGLSLEQGKVIDRKNKVVRTLVAGVKSALTGAGVTVVMEGAKILSKNPGDGVFTVQAGEQQYQAKNLLLATGSGPLMPPIPGLREQYAEGFVLANKEILELREVPRRLAVIGGGVIGLEMASYYQAAGSEVTILEMLPKIGGQVDEEIARLLQKSYEKKGVTFCLEAKVTGVRPGAVLYEKDGEAKELPCDKVLASIGRGPNTQGLGLEELGVAMEGRAVKVDGHLVTNVPGLYAVGDVNGKVMLAHTAYREGEVAVNTVLGLEDAVDYANIPAVIYTNPEAAWAGLTEAAAAAMGIEAETKTVSMRFSGRYLAENEGGDGICKLVLDKKARRLLGVHMIGNHSSEAITAAALLLQKNVGTEEIARLIFPHPSVSEIIREGIHN